MDSYESLQVIIMSRTTAQRTPFLSVHANPIYIEDQSSKRHGKYVNTIATIGRLPQLESDNKFTNLFYSKFIVKGVKPINQQAIITKLKKSNSQQMTRKVTRQTTNYTKDPIVKQEARKDVKLTEQSCNKSQDKIFDFSIESSWRKNNFVASRNNGQDQKYIFQRSMSAKNVARPQTAVMKSASSKTLVRPQSAAQGRNAKEQTKHFRPQTAVSRSSSQKKNITKYYQYQETQPKPNILTISQYVPQRINVDYIEKNKRDLSSKKKSVYLTAPENVIKSDQKQLVQKNNEFDSLKVRKRQHLSEKQKEMIRQKHREYLSYMKMNMPEQYRQCINYLSKMSSNFTEDEPSLLSMGIGRDQPLTMTSKQIQQFQVQQFYHNLLNQCIDTQYALKKARRVKDKEVIIQGMLNIDYCQKLLSLYETMQNLRKQGRVWDHVSNSIKEAVKNLSFYRNLRPQMFRKVFEMKYQIVQMDENELVIERNSQIKSIYVILNGSVTKKNEKSQEEQQYPFLAKSQQPQFFNTLFDGEVFGFPNKVTDKLLNYSIKTVEKCLFMVIPYESYRSALRSNQSLQDQINILKQIFPNTSNKFSLNNQDYESLAFQMEIRSYSAQEIVVREGENFQNLLIVANGCINVCFESVIRRKKENVDPLRKKRKYAQKKTIKVADLRKNNLFNYELLWQDQQQMQYYYCQAVQQKIRGDVINWKGFQHALINDYGVQDHHKIGYSLMSAQDTTKVYILPTQKFEALSEQLKTVIRSKVETNYQKERIARKAETSNKWQNYKIKLCEDIIRSKQTKSY